MKHTPALTYCLTQMRNAIVKGESIVARDFAVSIMRAYRGTLGRMSIISGYVDADIASRIRKS